MVDLADLSLRERLGIKSLISDGEILRGLVHVHLRHNLLLLQNKCSCNNEHTPYSSVLTR